MSPCTPNSEAKVSVITPFLNGEEFIDEAVSSVLGQTYDSWELLLVDDGSSDGSSTKARQYADRYPEKIRYLEHPGHINLGQGPSRNMAVLEAQGKYIAFLDADDVWLPGKLSDQVRILDLYPQASMTYGPYYFWYSWTGRQEDIDRDKLLHIGDGRMYGTMRPPPEMLLWHIEFGNGLPTPCSVLVRKTAFEAVGGFDEEFPGMYDDEALFAKLTINYPVFVTEDCWDKYRQHENSFCARAKRDGEWDPYRNAPSNDRVRFLQWLLEYAESGAVELGTKILSATNKRISELEIPA